MNSSGKAILIYRVGQLGDTLVSMPAIHAIREKYPTYSLILLTDKHPNRVSLVSSWNVLGPTGWFDDVIFYVPPIGFWQKLKTMLVLAIKLKSIGLEYVFDLSPTRTVQQANRDRLFFQKIVGVGKYICSGASKKPAKNFDNFLPRIEPEWRRLLNCIRLDSQISNFVLPIPLIEREKANIFLQNMQINEIDMILAIAPGSNRPTTKWPSELYSELGKRLLQHFPTIKIIILGGKEDKELGDKLCVEWGCKGHNLAGELSVYGSAAVLKHCTAYVGNDTGTMHLAAMVGKPCVALFSARNYPGEWEPYGNNHMILRHDTECAGCRLDVCDEHRNKCLTMISVDEVFDSISSMLHNVCTDK